MHRIQAAVLRRPGGALAIERCELEGPRPDEVLVRMVASGICRTDIDLLGHGARPGEGLILGHEGAGIVEQAGSAVKGFAPGDPVVMSYASCGRCRECRGGHPAGCERFWDLNFGFARPDGTNAYHAGALRGHFFGQSSFASHTVVSPRNLVRVSRRLPLKLLAPLGCGLQTGAATVLTSLKVRRGMSVAVFGAGAVGLAAVMAAREAGAAPIIAIDIRRRRLELARELGATHTVWSRRGADVAARVTAIAGAGVDGSVDSSGAGLEDAAVRVLKPGGTAALLSGAEGSNDLPRGKRVIGVIQGDAVPQVFIPRLIRMHRAGRFPFDRLVTFYPFAEINRAIADARRGAVVKPVLTWE